MSPRRGHLLPSVLQYGHVLPKAWLARRMLALPRNLLGANEAKLVHVTARQKFGHAHPQNQTRMSFAFAAVCHLLTTAPAQERVRIGPNWGAIGAPDRERPAGCLSLFRAQI